MDKRGVKHGLLVGILITLFLLAAALYLTRPGGDEGIKIIGDVIYFVYAGIAAITGFIAMRAYTVRSPQGKVLAFIATATLLDAIAGVMWAYYEIWLGLDAPFPTVADYTWLLFYIVAITGLAYAVNKIRMVLDWKRTVAAVVVWAILFFYIVQTIFSPIFADETQGALNKFLSAMYPAGDLVILLLAALLFLALKGSIFGPSWLAFTLAYAAFAIGDLNYGAQLYAGTYVTGGLVDLFWYACYMLLIYGFYRQYRAVNPV